MNADELLEKAWQAYVATGFLGSPEALQVAVATVVEACADELHDALAYTDTDKQADEFLLGRILALSPKAEDTQP